MVQGRFRLSHPKDQIFSLTPSAIFLSTFSTIGNFFPTTLFSLDPNLMPVKNHSLSPMVWLRWEFSLDLYHTSQTSQRPTWLFHLLHTQLQQFYTFYRSIPSVSGSLLLSFSSCWWNRHQFDEYPFHFLSEYEIRSFQSTLTDCVTSWLKIWVPSPPPEPLLTNRKKVQRGSSYWYSGSIFVSNII